MTHRTPPITDAVAARRAIYVLAVTCGADPALVRQLREELDEAIRLAQIAKLPAKATAAKAQTRAAWLRRRRA